MSSRLSCFILFITKLKDFWNSLPHIALGTCWRSLLPAVYQFMEFHPSVTVRSRCLKVGSLCLDENQSLFSFLILSSVHTAQSSWNLKAWEILIRTRYDIHGSKLGWALSKHILIFIMQASQNFIFVYLWFDSPWYVGYINTFRSQLRNLPRRRDKKWGVAMLSRPFISRLQSGEFHREHYYQAASHTIDIAEFYKTKTTSKQLNSD